jgi:hypothetical protein
VKGFAAAFRDAVERKFRELSGRKWQKATEQQKRAEAARRGAREVARRIERITGKRPAESTIRRNARRDTTPKGADQQRLDRQAAIDRAGGVKKFAQKAGISERRVGNWRNTGAAVTPGPPGVEAIDVEFEITCDIFHYGARGLTPEYDRKLDNSSYPLNGSDLTIAEPEASSFVIAFASSDDQAMKDILGEQMELQVVSTWHGRPQRNVVVKEIHSIVIRG